MENRSRPRLIVIRRVKSTGEENRKYVWKRQMFPTFYFNKNEKKYEDS